MSMVQINWKPDSTELRKFGVSMIVGFAIIGGVLYWRDHTSVAYGCFAFGAVSGFLGLTGTRAALPIYVAWMAVAFVMGNIVSRLLLALVYYGLFTPMGLAMRLGGRDTLQLKRADVSSYWSDIPESQRENQYERQF